MKVLLSFLALACCCGLAQSRVAKAPAKKATAPAPPAPKWPITSLNVDGLHSYTREQVLAVAGLKIGQIAGKPDFDAARDRLIASGAFETVGYNFSPDNTGKGYAAGFQVVEFAPAYPVRFEELGVTDREIDTLLHAKDPLYSAERLPATQPVLDRYVKWIQEYLTSRNVQEKVVGIVRPIKIEQMAIVFRPERNLPAVSQVTFDGNQVLSQRVLQEAILAVAVGAPYTEEHFRELLDHAVRPVYEARGRVRVAFLKIRTQPAKEVQGLDVFVTVDEGQSYELGKVTIDGPTPVKADELLKAGNFKTGDVANFDRVDEGLDRIKKAVRHAGYLDVKVTPRRRVDDANKKVDVMVEIEAGPLYTMGKLTLVGLDLDSESEINRIFTMKPGKPFNPEYPEFFLGKIREEGLFDNLGKTKSDYKINPVDHTADVTLTFAGANPDSKPGRGGRGGRIGGQGEN